MSAPDNDHGAFQGALCTQNFHENDVLWNARDLAAHIVVCRGRRTADLEVLVFAPRRSFCGALGERLSSL